MFEDSDEPRAEQGNTPKQRAEEKGEELRMFAELAAVFEGPRKFDAELLTDLTPDAARELQQSIGRLEKQRLPPHHLFIPDTGYAKGRELLSLNEKFSTNDYHIHRRPGETHILRLLAGEEVDMYYTRLQAHFDAGLAGFVEDERSAHAWRNDPKTTAFLETLESFNWNLPERYARPLIREHGIIALSTQIIDEVNIELITDQIMNRPPADLVGQASAPNSDPDAEAPSDADRAWFFKLFFLRGLIEKEERILLYTFLQKTDDSFDF